MLARITRQVQRAGTIGQHTLRGLYELLERYGENGADLRDAAATAFLIAPAAQEPGAAPAPGARQKHARHGLHAVPVIAAIAGIAASAARRTWAGHKMAATFAAMTTAAMTTAAVTISMTPAPMYTAIPKTSIVLPAATAPASAALATLPPRHRRSRRRQAVVLPPPARPVPSGSPAPKPSPSSSSPAPLLPGTLVASQPSVTLSAGLGGISLSARIVLTAQGGPVDWTLTCSPGLTLDQYSGHLDDGQSVTVTVTAADPLTGGTIWLPGGTAVQVRAPGQLQLP